MIRRSDARSVRPGGGKTVGYQEQCSGASGQSRSPAPDYRRPLRDGHDQDRGRLQRAAGAALLAGNAALRAGAGKVAVATAAESIAALGMALPEARIFPLQARPTTALFDESRGRDWTGPGKQSRNVLGGSGPGAAVPAARRSLGRRAYLRHLSGTSGSRRSHLRHDSRPHCIQRRANAARWPSARCFCTEGADGDRMSIADRRARCHFRPFRSSPATIGGEWPF
jgi:hypothetical protein